MLIGLMLIEAIFGSWFASNKLEGLNILRNRVWHYDFDYSGISDSERRIIYSRDEWGLRGEYGAPEDIDLLTVGGSTTDQRYISDGFTWQDVLSKNFQTVKQSYNVANAGVDGRTSFGHQYDFELWFPNISGLEPKHVMLYIGINDMVVDREGTRHDQPYSQGKSLALKIKGNSALYSLMQTVLGTYLVEDKNAGHGAIDYANAKWSNTPSVSSHAEKLDKRLDAYQERLYKLTAHVKEMGATPIIVTQTMGDWRFMNGTLEGIVSNDGQGLKLFDDTINNLDQHANSNGVDHYIVLSLFNEVSMAVCRQVNGICIDLARELEFDTGDFYDRAHNTKQGAEKIGNYLFEQLNKRIQ